MQKFAFVKKNDYLCDGSHTLRKSQDPGGGCLRIGALLTGRGGSVFPGGNEADPVLPGIVFINAGEG